MADKSDKPSTAVNGNAPGGQDFQSDTPLASGNGAALGAQVRPEAQLTESDGNRTYANPAPDPGPYIPEGGHPYNHPDPNQGETIGDVNKPVKIVQRNDTARDAKLNKTDMAPDLIANHAASDMYNPEKGEGLTDMAKARAAEGRALAPTSEAPTA